MKTELNSIEFTVGHSGYILYYMPDKMTESQALRECEFFDGGCCDIEVYPYFIIIPKLKSDIMQRIRQNIYQEAFEEGYRAGGKS